MPQYAADIGTWEKGRRVEFSAGDETKAVIQAVKLLNERVIGGEFTDSAYVVRVGEINDDKKSIRIFYEYMDGFRN